MSILPLKCNDAGIQLIKQFEGCSLSAYPDERGIISIGWGHAGAVDGQTITQDEADALFLSDLANKAEKPLNLLIKQQLTENQFSALCSLCYNIGSGNFAKSSVLEAIDDGNIDDVPSYIVLWNKINGQKSNGLLRRRQAECELWNKS